MRNAGPSEYIPVRWRNAALIANDKRQQYRPEPRILGQRRTQVIAYPGP